MMVRAYCAHELVQSCLMNIHMPRHSYRRETAAYGGYCTLLAESDHKKLTSLNVSILNHYLAALTLCNFVELIEFHPCVLKFCLDRVVSTPYYKLLSLLSLYSIGKSRRYSLQQGFVSTGGPESVHSSYVVMVKFSPVQ